MLSKNDLDLKTCMAPAGENAVLLELADCIDPAINAFVHCLDAWLREDLLTGVIECVPGYASILVYYDSQILNYGAVCAWLEARLASCPDSAGHAPRQIEIPVHYGGQSGPDLAHVAAVHQLSLDEVIRRHTTPDYRVGMMGFTPGFAYLMGLDPKLATPRLDSPRTQVPTGSVGIAGGQTGIYPLQSPGGWQLIGRTDVVLFDPEREPPFLLAPGDVVRFVSLGVDA